jgi:L-aspartate oxidase
MTRVALRVVPASDVAWSRECDVVIVGTGAAGLSAALEASRWGRRVLLLSKGRLGDGATPLAQGGLAAVTHPEDSVDLHVRDTLASGAGLGDERAAFELASAAPDAISALVDLGARFDRDHVGLEGGHSRHRIVHAGGDASGAEVHRTLRRAVIDAHIEVLEHTAAIDVLTDDAGSVTGLLVGRVVAAGSTRPLDVGVVRTRSVVLAAGGLGQAYTTSSNPLEATGDGVALAARAGADISDIEFVQFHPTVMFLDGQRGQRPLLTEALRGAGGVIVDEHGSRVMAGRHPLGDLAPRDVVALAMHRAIASQKSPSAHLWLDVRSLGRQRLHRDFPTATALGRSFGIDPVREPIPVAPGAHYACGGVRADMDGRTSVTGLYAVGEVATTGVHGANRLASNSLTEALITGRRLGRLLGQGAREIAPSAPEVRRWTTTRVGVDPSSRGELAQAMSNHAGILRTREGLEDLLRSLARAPEAASRPLDLDTLEATNLHTVSTLIARAALLREESRGSHQRDDFPEARSRWAQRITLRAVNGEVVARSKAPVDA